MMANLTSRWTKHGLVVEAAARARPDLPFEFRIYGQDPSDGGRGPGDAYVEGLLARIKSAGLGDRFRLAGFEPDPARVMGEIDVLVHTADQESFGRTVIEAMAAGLPVVGVRGGGVGSIVEHGVTGLLAEPDDADGLDRACESLVSPEVRARMGTSGRERAGARYSLQSCAQGVFDAYRFAAGRPLTRSVGCRPA